MDTYKRSIRGLQSRSNGEHFEGMIIAASRFYEERGIAAVDKTPEAFKVLKAMDRNRGQFICCFTKQAQPDFKGILMDSTMILFDAKHTDKDKISRDVLNISIRDKLADYQEQVPLQETVCKSIRLGFDSRLVLETLKAFTCDNIALGFTSPRTPMIVEAEDSDMKAMVLPVAIREA